MADTVVLVSVVRVDGGEMKGYEERVKFRREGGLLLDCGEEKDFRCQNSLVGLIFLVPQLALLSPFFSRTSTSKIITRKSLHIHVTVEISRNCTTNATNHPLLPSPLPSTGHAHLRHFHLRKVSTFQSTRVARIRSL